MSEELWKEMKTWDLKQLHRLCATERKWAWSHKENFNGSGLKKTKDLA